jgi:hypothetical protein
MARTAVKGYLKVKDEMERRKRLEMKWDPETLKYVPGLNSAPDSFMELRLKVLRRTALRFRPMLKATLKYAPNEKSAVKCREVMELYRKAFGAMTMAERIRSVVVRILASREQRRIKKEGVIMRQPPMYRVTYPDRTAEDTVSSYSASSAQIMEDTAEIKIA